MLSGGVGRLMARRDIIVMGGSIGGLQAMQTVLAGLPPDLAASLFLVLHIGEGPSLLPELLRKLTPLHIAHATDGAAIEAGHIYVAPPDRHLLLSRGHMHLSRGPRENWTRPALDPLFRSAAAAYGAQVIGVILSGALSDGTAGLSMIKRDRGIAVVQGLADALETGMPQSALDHVAVDHCIRADQMAPLLVRLTREDIEAAPRPPHQDRRRHDLRGREYEDDTPVALICPECGGAMRESTIGTLGYY